MAAKKCLKPPGNALDKKEYAWAAKLADQLYLIDNQDMDARQLKADALRQMAYVSTGGSDRAHLMSQALALEGKVHIARVSSAATCGRHCFADHVRKLLSRAH